LAQARALIEAAEDFGALETAMKTALEPLGAPYFRLALYAPAAPGKPHFEALVEHVPEPLTLKSMTAANPNFHRDLRMLFEREDSFDSHDDDQQWRVSERKSLRGDAFERAGVVHHITAPRFGARGLMGYGVLFFREQVEHPALRAALCMLIWSGVKRATDLARGGSLERASPLTRRQAEALSLCAQGKSDWDIAQLLGVSEATAHEHMEGAKRRLGVKTRVQAVAKAIQMGWLAA
jgi:DNA-binding CsgD family transcriptional regulator